MSLNLADMHYQATLADLLDFGVKNSYEARTKLSDGSTINYRSLPFPVLHNYRLSHGEFPLTTVRPTAWKSAIKEILWIFQDKSTDVNLLKEKYGVKWWDEWMLEDGTIGKSYGYQIANQKRTVKHEDLSSTYRDEHSELIGEKELDQIDWLINKIETKPDRRMIMSMFSPEDESEKALQECAYETIWRVVGDELHMTLVQRSSDFSVAGILNQLGHSALLMMVAQSTGYKPGTFSHFISDVHLYDNQVEQAKEILERTPIDCSPRLHLNAYGKNFYDITLDDFEIENYITHPQIKFGEIAK